jgi:ATP synthase protein I
MDLLRERRQPSLRQHGQGPGDAFAMAFEFAATVAIFLGLGWLLDRWLGTAPVFMVALAMFALIGKSVLLAFAYDQKMKQHEADRPSGRSPGRTP